MTTPELGIENIAAFVPPTESGARSFAMQKKVVLLLLTLRAPGNERTVRDKSILKTNADTSRLHVGKRLMDCPEQKAITIVDGQCRDWIARLSLPSPFKAGTHVIALGLLDTIDKGLLNFQRVRGEAIDALAAVYDEAKAEAKTQLGDLFREEEYLTAETLKDAYAMSWQYVTLTPPDELKALNQEVFEREKARLTEQWDAAIDDMRDALAVGMKELMDDMVTRLEGDEKKFKPTKLLGRFDEFLATFDARNVTGDGDLAELAAKCRALLTGVDTETLKKSKDVRETLRAGMMEAKAQLGQLETAGRSQRRISFEEE